MRFKLILLACFLSAALISSSSAQTVAGPARKPMPQQSAQPGDTPFSDNSNGLSEQISRLSIAGVSWGQREEVVLAKLQAAGFTVTSHNGDGLASFEEQVEIFLEKKYRPDHSYEIEAQKTNESITVEMQTAPDGWRVSGVFYAYMGGLHSNELEKAAIVKYRGLGFEINGQSGWNIIVLPSARSWSSLPHITIIPRSEQFVLRLNGGESGDHSFTKPFDDAVAKRKGLTKPSF